MMLWKRRPLLATLLAVLVSLASGPSAHALEALRPSLKELSEKIARFLKGREEKSIAVGAFTGPPKPVSSAGPGIKHMLIEELQRQQVRVTADARLIVKGGYRDVLDESSKLLALRLKADLEDSQGETVVRLDKKIEDTDVIAQVLGITRPDPGAGLTPARESAVLAQLLAAPQVLLVGANIQAAPRSRYALEVLVKSGSEYRPLQPTKVDGQAFVDIQRGQVFAIKLLNDADHDCAVELRLDGLSAFAFSENKGYRQFIVPRKGSTLIKGWHRTNMVSDEFVITDYSKSAVAELLANPDGIGTITATFAAAWGPNEKPPEDEGSKFRDPFNQAIGRGSPVQTPFKEVVRQSGRVRDVISIRYKKPSAGQPG